MLRARRFFFTSIVIKTRLDVYNAITAYHFIRQRPQNHIISMAIAKIGCS